jgi:hypothetical protein
VPPGLVDHAGDRRSRSLQCGVDDPPLLCEPLAETGQFGAVDHASPLPASVVFGDVELDGT